MRLRALIKERRNQQRERAKKPGLEGLSGADAGYDKPKVVHRPNKDEEHHREQQNHQRRGYCLSLHLELADRVIVQSNVRVNRRALLLRASVLNALLDVAGACPQARTLAPC